MDQELYKAEALRQLRNPVYYKPLPSSVYLNTAEKITSTLYRLFKTGYITTKQFTYLKPNPDECNSRYFYLLPKIHKPRTSWPHPYMPAGRPIVSDVNTESSRICQYIDYFLQPHACTHPAYLKDTYHFIQKIRGTIIQPHWLLITADVESLYTNMRIDLIIQSIKQIFIDHPDPHRPDEGILELLELTLTNNDFEFNGYFYLQLMGVAMGRKYAPSAANIYLRRFDQQAMEGFKIKPSLYSRFLDDIFGIWPGSRQELTEFEQFLNSLIPGIKITFTIREQIIEFLDTHVYKAFDANGLCTLQTKVYFKPTDTHQLLHRKSFHPTHTFTGIVKSQFIRFKRISSTIHDYNQASSTLIHTLHNRGYSLKTLLRQKNRIWHHYKPTKQQQDEKDEIIPVITYYDLLHTRLNRQWCNLIRSNPVFQLARILSAYKRHKNLRDFLVQGRFGTSTQEDPEEAKLTALVEALLRNP